MRKIASLLFVILLCAISQAETLKVDFGNSATDNVQSGHYAYYAGHEQPATFTTQTYGVFGSTVSVTPAWALGAEAAGMQMMDRGAQSYEDATEPLMRDWIGTDTRSVGDPLTLTISGLPAGTYAWLSYHHDTAASNMGAFDVTLHDAIGSTTTTNIQITGNTATVFSDVGTFTTPIVSNGIDDVTLVFDQRPYSFEYNQAWFIMNGFEVTAVQIEDPWYSDAPLRRPISPEQPMWLVHIDTWNFADPQKIIDLIPADIRPYVVFNISLSISHDEDGWSKVDDGYETAKSWLRTCAENRVWAMIQPSSGGFSHFSDFDLSVYEEFYRDYPNFIGFNYCEQFWGYDSTTDSLSAVWTDRIAHFANLLELSHQYGGYLVVSWCGNQWAPSINPIAMLKRIPAFAAACRDYTENYILCEKYTTTSRL